MVFGGTLEILCAGDKAYVVGLRYAFRSRESLGERFLSILAGKHGLGAGSFEGSL